jgi:hypothetical protein
VSKLKDLGVTMAIIHFYKGFGLLLKKYGICVGVYVGSTLKRSA